MRVEGWSEDKVAAQGAVGPEEREQWTGGGPVWTQIPDRQFVHSVLSSYGPDGIPSYEPLPIAGRWTWEFETDSFTTKAAEYRTEVRPHGTTEAHVRGVNRAAVRRAYARRSCPSLWITRSGQPVCPAAVVVSGDHAELLEAAELVVHGRLAGEADSRRDLHQGRGFARLGNPLQHQPHH